MSPQKKELVIVEPMPPDAAKQQFIRWREEHPELASRLGPNDLIVDHMCGRGGETRHRYRIFIDEAVVGDPGAISLER
jgi:hypothetical protein